VPDEGRSCDGRKRGAVVKIIDPLTGKEIPPNLVADISKWPGRIITKEGLIMTTSEGANPVIVQSSTGRALLPNWLAPIATVVGSVAGLIVVSGAVSGQLLLICGIVNVVATYLLGNTAGAREGALNFINRFFGAKPTEPAATSSTNPPKPSV
jgi:hypothetical protein